MRCHGRKPIEGIKDLFHLSVFGLVKDFEFLGKIGHPLLGEGGPATWSFHSEKWLFFTFPLWSTHINQMIAMPSASVSTSMKVMGIPRSM